MTFPSTTELARKLASIHKRMTRLTTLLSDTEEDFDEVVQHLLEVEKVLSAAHPIPLRPRNKQRTARGLAEKALRDEAARGASTVKTSRAANGHATVQIDGRAAVPLSPLLGKLLEILATDNGCSTDHLVSWKSVSEISGELSKQTGKQFQRHTITASISRLKKRLEDRDENKFFIQRNAKLGYRFALRRGSDHVTEDNHR